MPAQKNINAIAFIHYKLIVAIIFFIQLGFSQTDSTYLTNYSDKILLKVNVDTQNNSYLYRNFEDGSKLHLVANNRFHLFLSVDYEFIGASIGVGPNFFGADFNTDLKGESIFTDFKFRIFLGNWIQTIEYKNIGGFYVKNTGDFVPEWNEGQDSYIQFKGLENTFYGMSTSYVFNPNFSYRNIAYQTEWQRKSSGSPIASLKYNYSIFDLNDFNLDDRETYFTVMLSPAYYYTYVIKENWFLAGNLSPSIGYRFSTYESNAISVFETEKKNFVVTNLNGGVNLGYSSEKVVFGINLAFSSDWYSKEKNAVVENEQFYGVIYLGYRFGAPRFIQKLFKPFTSRENSN